jgi:hypothetical protein
MYKKVLLFPIIALTLMSPVYAASPAPTPSSEPPGIDEVTQNLKKRLQASLETTDVPAISSARAYVGVVKDVIKDTIILQDKDGKKDIKLVEDTTILRTPGNAVIKADNIRIDDYIIAIGYLGQDNILTGRRLIVSADPIKSPPKISGIGTIEKLGKTSLTLRVDGQDQIFTLTGKTIYKSAGGSIELADLAVGDTLIFTALVDDNSDLTATILMRIGSTSIAQ